MSYLLMFLIIFFKKRKFVVYDKIYLILYFPISIQELWRNMWVKVYMVCILTQVVFSM